MSPSAVLRSAFISLPPLVACSLGACDRAQSSPVAPSPSAAPSAAAPASVAPGKAAAGSAAPGAEAPAELPKRGGVVVRKGESRTLVGPELAVGDRAPEFELVTPALGKTKLSDLAGRVVLLSVVPSIDTPVCEAQTGRLAAEAPKLEGVELITVSRDLPFAQRRFLADNGLEIAMVSDFDQATFGKAWGLYIEETGLLARSLWVIGKDGKIAYRQIVHEQSSEPEYEPALAAARELATAP